MGKLSWRKTYIEKEKIPVHIAIIPDGNGRWAKRRGMPRMFGHRVGSDNLKKIVKQSSELGLKYLSVYAFSTENWSRPESEVNALMDLLIEYLKNAEKELSGTGIKLKVIGNRQELTEKLQTEIIRVEKLTENNKGMVLVFALNYGGRYEIMNSLQIIIKNLKDGKIKYKDVDENYFQNNLYTCNIPDPDIIIRTSGEQRLSNFLLWQSAYSELFFPKVLWPDFGREHFIKIIKEYQKRKRRFGGI